MGSYDNELLKAVRDIEESCVESLRKLDTKQREIDDRLLDIEQKGSAIKDVETKTDSKKSIGELFIKQFDSNREFFEKTRSVRLEIKAAGDPVTTASGRTIISAGVGSIGVSNVGMQYGIPIRVVGGVSAVEYSRYTGQTGSAGVQTSEGAAKSALRPEHSLITQSAITIAGYTKMSRQALNDSAELRNAVDVTIAGDVNANLNALLNLGSVSPAFAGFYSLAQATTSAVYTSLADAISETVANMQIVGFNPDTVFMSPGTWLGLVVAKAADGHYMTGNYLGVLPDDFRGLKVVLSPGIAAGKAMVMDARHSELLIVDGFNIEVAYSGDDFTKNLVTVLGEMRVIPVYRTAGSAVLVTPKP